MVSTVRCELHGTAAGRLVCGHVHEARNRGIPPPRHVAIAMRYSSLPEGPTVVVWLCDACVEQHQPPSASAARDAVWAFLERLGEHVWPMCVTCADAIGAPQETSEIVLEPDAVTGP